MPRPSASPALRVLRTLRTGSRMTLRRHKDFLALAALCRKSPATADYSPSGHSALPWLAAAESLYDKDCPHAQMLCREAYRAAALLGNSEAQYRCGKLFMESGHFWMDTVAGLLSCDKQKDYAVESYAEGLKFLQDAESNGHALAKREHGLAYIHGWGVEQDTQKGYELVIKSIDVEGSWDNATEIFQSLGLNSTEFFSMLGALRKQ